MNFASKKAFFPDKSDVIKQPFVFHACAQAKILTFLFANQYRSPFFLCLSSLLAVFLPTLSSCFFAWNCGWPTFKEKDKFNLQRVVG